MLAGMSVEVALSHARMAWERGQAASGGMTQGPAALERDSLERE